MIRYSVRQRNRTPMIFRVQITYETEHFEQAYRMIRAAGEAVSPGAIKCTIDILGIENEAALRMLLDNNPWFTDPGAANQS